MTTYLSTDPNAGDIAGQNYISLDPEAGVTEEQKYLSMDPEAGKTSVNLFSSEGISSTLRSIGPSMALGVMGEQLQAHENVKAGWEKDPILAQSRGITEENYKEALQRIPEIQRSSQMIQEDISSPEDSRPLRWVKGAVQSIAQNAVGIAPALLMRGTPASIPAMGAGLDYARQQQEGQTYLQDRTPDVEGKIKGTVQQANENAAVSGVVEAGFEMIPVKFMMKELGKTGFIKFVTGYLGRELGTELPTTIAQDISTWSTTNQDQPVGEFLKQLGNDLIDTAAVTVLSAGAQGPVMHGIAKAGQAEERFRAGEPIFGDNKSPLSAPIIPPAQSPSEPPKWDWPTSPLNADADAATQALIASIDADLITPEAVAEANAIIAEETLKEKNPPLPEAKQAWSVLNANSNLDSGELGASAKETANSLTYDNPNKLPRADTTFMFGPGDAAGKTPNQVMPQAGTYVLGQESEDRSTEFLKAVSDDIEAWRQKYMPNATFVISNEALPFDNALGWHHYENGAHLIVPPAIRKPSKGFGAFSANKQAAAFYNLSHEFGHGLLKQVFMGETDPLTGAMLDQEARKGLVSEQTISQLPEGQQGIVREFNEKKQQILSGVMTAEQFQHEWAGPAKAGRKNFLERLSEQATALDLLRRIATDAVASAEKREAIDRKQEKFFFPEESRKRMIQGLMNDMMSFDEYFAEQTAKHAYKAKWEEGSATGNLFKQALNSLRQFFIDRKKDGIIAPGIAFSNWIEGLTKIEQVTNKVGVQENALKSKKTVAAKTEKKEKKAKTKVERLQHNAETDTHEAKLEQGKNLIGDLISEGKLPLQSPDAKTMLQLLKQKDYDEFIDLYKKYTGKKVSFDLKTKGGMWAPGENLKLAEPLIEKLNVYGSVIFENPQDYPDEMRQKASVWIDWAKKAAQNYLNKYAATEFDPLNSIEIPYEGGLKTWGKAFRDSISAMPAWLHADTITTDGIYENYPEGFEEWVKNIPPSEPIFKLGWSPTKQGTIDPRINFHLEGGFPYFQPTGATVQIAVNSKQAITSYLEHVGDYLAQNVSIENLQKYDLVRAVRETAELDRKALKEMSKKKEEKLKASREITAELTPFKDYGPGKPKWYEISNKLTPEQIDLNLSVETELNGICVAGVGHNSHGYEGYVPVLNIVTRKPVTDKLPRTNGYLSDTKSGLISIFVLRDETGDTHATVEVENRAQETGLDEDGNVVEWLTPDLNAIKQIKGKSNQAPIKEVLPFVQDFINSGNFAKEVGDLQNADLIPWPSALGMYTNHPSFRNLIDETFGRLKYYPKTELKELYERWRNGPVQNGQDPLNSEGRQGSFDIDVPDTEEEKKFIKGIKDFVTSPGPIRRALRRGQAMAYWSMQFQQLAHLHPEMSDAQDFRYFNTKYNGFKNFLQSTSDAFAKQWSDLSGENFDKVNKIVLDHLAGDKLWFDLVKTSKDINGQLTVWYKFQPNATTLDEFNKRGVDLTTPEGAELGELILNVQNDLLDKLNHLEIVLRGILAHRHSQNQRMLNAKVLILANKFKEIRQVPFFPQGRFGNLMVIIERQKQDGTGWEVISREAFESKAAQEKAHALAAKTLKPDERVQAKELTDQQYVLMALPTDFMDLAASELDLSAEQVDILMGILQPAKTEKSLRPYDKERMKIKGYSTDAMRSYANFTWHQANLISKLEYRVKFNLTISNIKSKLRTTQYAGPEAEKLAFDLQQMTTAMERARDYIMSPPNEAQTLRGIVAVTYLALNVKTALVNGVGLITTWSDMTERLGLIKGSALMARAVKQVFLTTKLTNLNERTESDSLPPETQKALDQALAEGVLAQSYAYYLAGVANAGNLFRIPSKQLISKTGKQLVDASMWAFRLMELGTRRISFLARFEHERFDKKQAFEDAYNSAVKAVNILQNEYSLGNRPAFLRGFKIPPGNPLGKYVEPIIPMATVFMSFPQHMAFHVFGGYQLGMRREMKFLGEAPRHKMGSYTAKLWVILLALAGYEGLPMAEDLLNWLDVAWRKWGGGRSLRQELREYIQSVEAFDLDPQLLAHGLGHDVGGFDLSRSIGMGRLMPGVGNLATPEQTVAGTVGTLVLDMFGPAGGLVKFGIEAVFGGKPLSESMTHFPGGIGNAYSAYYWSKYGVRSPEKAIISFDEETGKPRELTAVELWGKAAGFNPTVVSQNREIQSEQRELKIYWTARRAGLLDDVWTADWQKDPEGKADARRAVEDFNSSIPVEYKALRITGKNIQDSLVARRKAQRLAQQQKAPQKKLNAPYQEIRESFE